MIFLFLCKILVSIVFLIVFVAEEERRRREEGARFLCVVVRKKKIQISNQISKDQTTMRHHPHHRPFKE